MALETTASLHSLRSVSKTCKNSSKWTANPHADLAAAYARCVPFTRQSSDAVRCYQRVTMVADKAHSYANVIAEMNVGHGPDDRIRHVSQKQLNNRIKADHAALKQLLRPKRGFRKLTSAKNTLKGVETHRAIKKSHFANNETGVMSTIELAPISTGHLGLTKEA